MRVELSSRKDSDSDAKLKELLQAPDTDMRASKEKLDDRDLIIEGSHSQIKAKHDSSLGQRGDLRKRNIALYHITRAVLSLYSILLVFRERIQKSEKRADELHACAD